MGVIDEFVLLKEKKKISVEQICYRMVVWTDLIEWGGRLNDG